MSATHGGARCGADQLACIASFFSSSAQRRQLQSHGRLPLAWVAAAPSARLAAEQRHAWVVLPFDFAADAGCPFVGSDSDENAFGAALANATTPLFVLEKALGLDKKQTTSSAAGAAEATAVTAAPTVAAAPEAAGADNSTDVVAAPASPSVKVMSWISQAAESLADVNHAASPVEQQKPAFIGTSRAKPPAQKSTRPSTGVNGPRVEDPVEVARSCGVHVGGLTTVLVSGAHLYDSKFPRTVDKAAQRTQHKRGAAANADSQCRHINHSGKLLFPSTTCCGGSVSSLLSVPPNAAVFDRLPSSLDERHNAARSRLALQSSLFKEGAELHEDDGGAVDETAHDPQTAASVYTVQQVHKLHDQARRGDLAEAHTTLWYRHIFIDAEEVTADVVCGVSRWWLQRPVHLHELPTTRLRAALQAREADVAATAAKNMEASPVLRAPPLYVKYMADIGADLWWPHRLLSVVHHRFAEHPWHAVKLLRWLVFLYLLCAAVVESVVRGVPEVPAQHATTPHGVDLVAAFHKLGEVYGGDDQLAALDVSHTGVRGAQLLACALGKVLGTWRRHAAVAKGPTTDSFHALDVAGCIQLHHRQGELHQLSALLSAFHSGAAEQAVAQEAGKKEAPCPLALVDLLMSCSLHDDKTRIARSATGLALALLSHHGRLTWLSGAGCSLDNVAMRELGTYALLVEAVHAARSHRKTVSAAAAAAAAAATPSPWSCSICAMDLTSALSLDDLNPVAYLAQLEQLLVPFNYVTDDGVVLMDGHTYPQDLREFLTLCPAESTAALPEAAQVLARDAMKALEHFSAPADGVAAVPKAGSVGKAHQQAVEALHQLFRSHLYQIDFTYCSCLSNVNGLVHQQRLELLNMSQTRINKAGLFSVAREKHRNGSSPAGSRNPPLRLFIAEMCEHLSDLSGLAHLDTLECIIVRSGSLGDDGLHPVCTTDMRNLQLIDLSYCDRLHHVGCLANLPALQTLILDSTDVTPAEVRKLRQSRSLETLSVRFCTEFAFIGKSRTELEAVTGVFPSLKHYVYEDLIGDAELRKKKTN